MNINSVAKRSAAVNNGSTRDVELSLVSKIVVGVPWVVAVPVSE